ncbi:MAG: hypothetical protein DRI77_04665 [Chloroflexi bacterium]|nr:MAG: hypothetical protein DRI77_04665 [Chloroflexota bacterium]
MSEQYDEPTIRRILVALDASRYSLAALEAAIELAAGLEAELQGIFVEDVNLLRAAGSPAAREVQYPFVAGARLDRKRMEREMRAQAAQARQSLVAACEHLQVKWSFRVVRGEVAPEVLAAALGADLLSLGKASRPLVRRPRMGSTARAAASRAPKSVFLLQRDVGIQPPVMVTYDGSPLAWQALRIAAHLARRKGGCLIVLVVAGTSDEEYRLQAETADWLRQQGVLIRYRRLARASAALLTRQVQSEGGGVLVLGATLLPPGALQTLLDGMDCPVLLVR